MRIAPDHPLTFTLPTARMYVEHHPPMPDAPTSEIEATIDRLADPDALRDDDRVDWCEGTKQLPDDEFEHAREDLEPLDGWAVVGVENDAGAVLLMDDGEHGWTLPAIPVDEGDWAARAREVVEGLTGKTATLDRVERVRRLDYHEESGDCHVAVHHAVVRAEQIVGEPVADTPAVGCDTHPDVGWFEALPDDVEGPVAADARLFL